MITILIIIIVFLVLIVPGIFVVICEGESNKPENTPDIANCSSFSFTVGRLIKNKVINYLEEAIWEGYEIEYFVADSMISSRIVVRSTNSEDFTDLGTIHNDLYKQLKKFQ